MKIDTIMENSTWKLNFFKLEYSQLIKIEDLFLKCIHIIKFPVKICKHIQEHFSKFEFD